MVILKHGLITSDTGINYIIIIISACESGAQYCAASEYQELQIFAWLCLRHGINRQEVYHQNDKGAIAFLLN
jgi:hypothetical protein